MHRHAPSQPGTTSRDVKLALYDLITTLMGASVFPKLDLNDGYHQLVLNEDLRHITKSATYLGPHRYKRLNSGINTAAELFQITLRQLLGGITDTINFTDDIFVFGKDKQAR